MSVVAALAVLALVAYVSTAEVEVTTIEEVRADNENLRRQIDELKRVLSPAD